MKNKTVISMTRHHWDMKFDQDKASHRIKRPSGRIIQTEGNLSSLRFFSHFLICSCMYIKTDRLKTRASNTVQEGLMRKFSLAKMW